MFKNRATGEHMYPIQGHEPYAISHTGKVGRSLRITGNNNEFQNYVGVIPHINNGVPYVSLNWNSDGTSNHFAVHKLYTNSVFGNIPCRIKFHDGDHTNLTIKNVYYHILGYRIEENVTTSVNGKLYKYDKMMTLQASGGADIPMRPIPNEIFLNNERYWISTTGAIYDSHKGVFVSRSNNTHGYYKAGVTGSDNERYTIKIHRAVYAAWIDSNLTDWTIDHIDGHRHNNNIENLERVSFQENVNRARLKNLTDDNVIRSRWSDNEVHLVCKMLTEYRNRKYIGIALGLDMDNEINANAINNLIYSIRSGVAHQNISRYYKIPSDAPKASTTPFKHSEEAVANIMRGLMSGKSTPVLAKEYPEFTKDTILGISSGRQYSHFIPLVEGMQEFMDNKANRSINVEKWVKEIMGKLITGSRPVELRDEYAGRIAYSTIKEINSGKNYSQFYSQVPGMAEYIENKRK